MRELDVGLESRTLCSEQLPTHIDFQSTIVLFMYGFYVQNRNSGLGRYLIFVQLDPWGRVSKTQYVRGIGATGGELLALPVESPWPKCVTGSYQKRALG